MRIAYVDFCRTLTFHHTLRGFFEFVAAHEGAGARLRLEATAARNRLRGGSAWSTARMGASFLAGRRREDLDALGKRYALEQVCQDLNPAMLERVRKLRAEGYRIVIVSAALIEYLAHCRELCSADEIVTNALGYTNGLATGRLAPGIEVYGPGKVEAIREYEARNGLRPDRRVCISDHDSDVPMLELADEAIVVQPNTPELESLARSKGWEVVTG